MIPIISFIGDSGSGKTTVIEKVVAELKKRSIKVAVIKHTHCDDLNFDKNGKDSQRFTVAGAEEVFVSGPRKIISMKMTDHDLSPREISLLIDSDIDLILTEGYKSAGTLKIEVHRKNLNSQLVAKPEQLMAVVTDEHLDTAVPQFDINKSNTIEIADLIEKWLSHQPRRETEIVVDKEFVELIQSYRIIRN
jgi:molybdopterin-guanine dinucleotide biosynthesis protein MobB